MVSKAEKHDNWTCKDVQDLLNEVLSNKNKDSIISFLRWWVPMPPTWNTASRTFDAVSSFKQKYVRLSLFNSFFTQVLKIKMTHIGVCQ